MTGARRLSDKRLVLASHNEGKLREFAAFLEPHGIAISGAAGLGLPEPEETGATFAENAAIKARAAALATGLPALADDSGLAVAALGGRPGIHSARWAGPKKDFGAAMQRVVDELSQGPGGFNAADRSAAFVCALCLAWPDGHVEVAEGRVEGTILPAPRGTGGFGYDPIFVPEGDRRSFGEMSPAEKAAFSHRARAMAALASLCLGDD